MLSVVRVDLYPFSGSRVPQVAQVHGSVIIPCGMCLGCAWLTGHILLRRLILPLGTDGLLLRLVVAGPGRGEESIKID